MILNRKKPRKVKNELNLIQRYLDQRILIFSNEIQSFFSYFLYVEYFNIIHLFYNQMQK